MGQNAKSKWWLNESEVPEKKVKELVKQLNVQTGNLCQFLPQDKVHDFSRMDSKQLLIKTVEAVGDVELRNDHEKLKEIQNKFERNTVEKAKKENLLTSLKHKREELEVDMEEIRRRKDMEKKLWCLVADFKITADQEAQTRDDIVLEKQDLET